MASRTGRLLTAHTPRPAAAFPIGATTLSASASSTLEHLVHLLGSRL